MIVAVVRAQCALVVVDAADAAAREPKIAGAHERARHVCACCVCVTVVHAQQALVVVYATQAAASVPKVACTSK